jgi:predicted nucleic acid-binding protein
MANVCLDTNVWFYALARPAGGDGNKQVVAQRLIESVGMPLLTPQIINELGWVLKRKQAWDEPSLRALISDLMARCKVHIPATDWPLKALALRQRHPLAYWDSLIVAAALDVQCTILYSEDMQHGHTIGDLRIIDPFR